MRAHMRSELHTYLDQPWLTPAATPPIEIPTLETRIEDAKRRLPRPGASS